MRPLRGETETERQRQKTDTGRATEDHTHLCPSLCKWENVAWADKTSAGIPQWLDRRIRDRKVAGSSPCRSGGIKKISRANFLCWLLFRYPFHPRVIAVARKRSLLFCQKCRCQVTVKHACALRMWLCMKWHGAWLCGVHRTCAETAAVSCGTMLPCQRCKYTTSVDIQKRATES